MAKTSLPKGLPQVSIPRPVDMTNPANKGGWFDPSKTRAEAQPKRHAFPKDTPYGPSEPRQEHQAPVPGIRGGGK